MLSSTFGTLLYQLRKRAGMTQSDLAAAVGYSSSFISGLEKGDRHVEWRAVVDLFVPALALHEEPGLAIRLVELAAAARGERPPASLSFEQKFKPAMANASQQSAPPLPNAPTPLVGREADVRLLINRFVGHSGRLMTLTGPPGVGKSRLALEAAARLKPQFEQGVRFIPLASIRDPERVALTICSELEIPDNGKQSPNTRLRQALRNQELLLVLDNFEQILPAAPVVAEMLAECSRVHILVTSRERLHLRAEQRFRVQPLRLADATQLFIQCASAAEPEFRHTTADLTQIDGICQRVDCLPLAIELVAARVDMFTPQMILLQLQKRGLDLLRDGPTDLPTRHRTLRSTIFDSYSLLHEKEQLLFRTLGVFRGGFDLEALQSVGGDEETLRSLLNKSLVVQDRRSSAGQRFFQLETLHEFACEQLAASGELFAAGNRHTQHFLRLVEQFDTGMPSDSQKFWVEKIRADYANVLQAIRWAIQQGNSEIATRFVWPMRVFWYWTPRWTEARIILQEILACAERDWNSLADLPQEALTPQQRLQIALFAKTLFTCSDLAIERSTANQILAQCAKVNAMVEPNDLTPPLLHSLSNIETEQGNFAAAIRLNQRCLQLLDSMPNLKDEVRKMEIAWTYKFLGIISFQQADLNGCQEYFARSAQVFAEINQLNMLAVVMLRLSDAELYLGEVEQARNLFETYANVLLASDYQISVPFVYSVATTLAIRQQQWQNAKTAISQGVQFLLNNQNEKDELYYPFLLIGKYAFIALQEQQTQFAAHLIGMAEMLRKHCAVRTPSVYMTEYDATVASIRAQMDAASFAAWHAQGQNMTEAEVFAFIVGQESNLVSDPSKT